jgi:uncharacterized membrane protein YqjE
VGTGEGPRSALNLRLVLAIFGLVSCTGLAGLLLWLGYRVAALVAALVGLTAIVDLVVIQRRRIRRRRAEPGVHHSLFE